MPTRDELTEWLDTLLTPGSVQDSTHNGLQVEGKTGIRKIGFSVDSSLSVFREASEKKVDYLVVHHGLIWGSWKKISGYERERLSALLDAGINLYVSHLPLDRHPEIGHNALICGLLGAKTAGNFGSAGLYAELPVPLSFEDFLASARSKINPETWAMGSPLGSVGRIAVSSGSFSLSLLDEAIRSKVDAVLTGEPSGQSMFYHPAVENGIGLVFAGHYETEIFGLRAVMEKVKGEFGIELETIFVGNPTGW